MLAQASRGQDYAAVLGAPCGLAGRVFRQRAGGEACLFVLTGPKIGFGAPQANPAMST